MSTELDLPLLPSAQQIRRREFASVRRGYDPDQVREYLKQVADQIENLERQLREARLSAGTEPGEEETGAAADDRYERLSRRFADLIATADREAERVVKEAKTEADGLLARARAEADRIRVDAQAHAETARHEGSELLERAKEKADGLLSGLSERREELIEQVREIQTRLLGAAKELEIAVDRPDRDDEATAVADAEEIDAGFDQTPDAGADVWVSTETMDLGDLPPFDLDFEDEDEDEEEEADAANAAPQDEETGH